jgi:hypothetical protein
VIGLEGGELHHNGTHWRSLLIKRKDRVPDSSVRTIRRLCAAGLVGSTLLGSRLPDAEIGLVIPSIAHAIISLCSMADWQS